MNHYKYDEIATMFLPKEDLIRLAHQGGRATLTVVNPPQPVAKRTRSQVAKLKKHIELMKIIPRLRKIFGEITRFAHSTCCECYSWAHISTLEHYLL
jgi:hypothetical protein